MKRWPYWLAGVVLLAALVFLFLMVWGDQPP
jgi:hypothetical protein